VPLGIERAPRIEVMDRESTERLSSKDRDYERRLSNEPESGRFAEPRSWWARTTDEVASWFGNIDALRRRQRDGAVGDHTGEGPKTDIDSDARIIEQVSQHLTEDATLNASKVEVLCVGGVVALNGEVTTSADKLRAENLAVATPGVTEVQNNLLVA
jgi:osmotically-inducible protein OsmY